MTTAVQAFFRDEEGQDMVEYGLLASFLSIVTIVAVKALGPIVNTLYVAVQTALTS
jgi:Flp pilus assembly pilin Flp